MRYVESNIPEDVTLRVHYRTSCRARTPGERELLPRWLTVAQIIDKEGHLLAEGISRCGPKDNPSRKIGRAIAVGRALKQAVLSKLV